MTSSWGWRPERTQGIWRHGSIWFRPLYAVAPWLSVAVCLLVLHTVGGALTSAKGLLFDLPAAGRFDSETTKLVALVVPMGGETTVFFDDARYRIADGVQPLALAEHLRERLSRDPQRTLLVLADRRVSAGDLGEFAAVARLSGAERILFANKRTEAAE